VTESDEIEAALAANAAFYAAFADGDEEAMEGLWATTAPVACVHPGAPPIHGRAVVMDSWRALLDAPPAIRASGAQASIVRGVAFVTCFEHIEDNALAATNVFVWEDGAWRLVHHQAGLVHPDAWSDDAPEGPLH
jgi:hypothetical protein